MPKFRTVYSWSEASRVIRSSIEHGTISHLSVDVFDTLLIRTTTPESVISATARFVGKRIGKPIDVVIEARRQAWAKECERACQAGRDPDAESISLFRAWIAGLADHGTDQDGLSADALEYELNSEKACLASNPAMVDVLETAKDCGVSVTALSDMYLSPEQVGSLLETHGLRHLVGEVITSGYLGFQKRTGRLFDWYAAGRPSLAGLLHVGDDLTADGRMPASRGITSIVVFDRARMAARHRLGAVAHFPALEAAISASEAAPSSSAPHEIGFSRFGPIYTGFIHGVAERAVADGVSSVWFLAREGWTLHELYEQFAASGIVGNAPPSGYLYASRVATMRAQLVEFTDKEVGSVHSDTWNRAYKSTLSPLQFNDEGLRGILSAIGLAPDDTVTEEGLSSLRQHGAFVDAVKAVGESERMALRAYLQRTGFPLAGKVAVVDVGWGGQIQENLERALRLIGATTEVVGYYLGTDERARARRDAGMRIDGLLSDKCNSDGSGIGAFSHVQGIELATRAAHGSVKGYDQDGVPRLAPEADAGRKAEAADDAIIASIQEGVLRFASAYIPVAGVLGVTASQSLALARDVTDIASLAPSRVEAEIITGMKNIANLGMDETLSLGANVSLRHPRHAMRVLRSTLWQEGTCATLIPWAGPLLFLAYRRIKKKLPSFSRASDIQAVSVCPAAPFDEGIEADVLHLDLTSARRRLACDGATTWPTVERMHIGTLGDLVKLAVIRALHGAPTRPVLAAVKTQVKAVIGYMNAHPKSHALHATLRTLRRR